MSAMFNRGAESQLGGIWEPSMWYDLTQNQWRLTFQFPGYGGGKPVEKRVCATDMWLRQIMGFTINLTVRDLIAYTVPILLMQSSNPLHFVMNSLAVTFIVQLDDINDPVVCTLIKDGESEYDSEDFRDLEMEYTQESEEDDE
eukprot:gnl/TRDRNA2_/TRDRNA2_158021_c1_seq2.p1 gnl/TRDRNA2_/TRDRNA2_158021_c1~~gnl/TRDRNA2_/TRDRNA2_158021_c1_seq2.p1  ORF type:complete len:143 (-),score=16.97 gnl/TRDRNA2_/TRDRNA2_158021_c1_seq2:219-647(-)